VQAGLEILAVIRALLWGAAAAVSLSLAILALNALGGIAAETMRRMLLLGWLAGIALAAVLLWRSRFAWAFDRVALWIEERVPGLAYSVVTASDSRYASSLGASAERLVARAGVDGLVRRAAVRSLAPAAAAVVVAVVLLAVAPAGWRRSLASATSAGIGNTSPVASLAGSKLARLTGRVIPPPYTRLRAEDLRDPSEIAAVQGSVVRLEGEGSPSGVGAELAYANDRRSALQVTRDGDRWAISFALSDTTPALLELFDRNFSRSVVVDPHADAAPSVKIRLPARDTVLRNASGVLHLSADVSDDIGLGTAEFEYIISSGSEETFSFKQGTLAVTRLDGKKTGTVDTSVPLSLFKLGEGDRLSVRAIAADLNSLTGPRTGFSETRTIRVARKDEYDSLSVEAAAPSGDTAMLSLRMLILETEKLEKERAAIARENLVARSRVLARQTDRIQDEVLPLFKEEGTDEPQVTMDTESTERPVPVSATLKVAVDALGQASRDLDVADTRGALPEMYKAYKALQSFRTFKRYYLRGATRPIIVDIQRVRLAGKTKGAATPMPARSAVPSDRDRMRSQYSAAVEQMRSAPAKAVTTLMMIRVESLKKYPALSAALEQAVSAIGRGADATAALLKVRRLLEGAPLHTDSLLTWGAGW